MRITKETVRRLADEAERVTGQPVLGGINHPGDGQTRYVMNESMTSVYKGARAAAAYLLGVLAGADPGGSVNWIEHRPGWVAEIDTAFRFGEIPAATVRAYSAGTEYGRTHRRAASTATPGGQRFTFTICRPGTDDETREYDLAGLRNRLTGLGVYLDRDDLVPAGSTVVIKRVS